MVTRVKTGAESLFTGEKHSDCYSTFRPHSPDNIISKITEFININLKPPFQQAIDVGCGSGQSTGVLAPYFERVVGIDVSEAQLKEASRKNKLQNVEYKYGSCDSMPVTDSSTTLVTASQAAHWFHLPSFFKEVDRVLVPGGVVALYCYGFPRPKDNNNELVDHLRHLYNVDTAGYWHESRKIVDKKYANIEMPYAEQLRDESVYEDVTWSVADYCGYIKTWSGYQALLQENADKANEAILNFQEKTMKTLKSTATPEKTLLDLRWKYTILMARKPLI